MVVHTHCVMCVYLFFFFSSRRRHTRWTGDWSSDVCSSDLADEISFVKRMFHRRHVYEHKGGEADAKYIQDSGDTEVRPKRSEERRVGKKCRSGGAPYKEKKKKESREVKRGRR